MNPCRCRSTPSAGRPRTGARRRSPIRCFPASTSAITMSMPPPVPWSPPPRGCWRSATAGRGAWSTAWEPVFLSGPGDLSVARQDVLPTLAAFPTGHYHGITVTVDPGLAPRCLSCFLEDVEVQPAALAEKFCAAGGYFAARSSRRVEHVFSELYQVPEDLRRGYLKVKILELLLFLSALEVPAQPQAAAPGLSRGQVSLARKTADYLLANTESKVTVQELSRHFGASAAQIQASFRGVYGRSPAAWLRLQKMHGAAELLRSTDRTVLDIAGQFGYDNASKFARAFRDVIGVSPNEYRSGVDQDSCAP
ncbi:MAG: helix-turn-helix domain-containing protein [Oscillospiraceae bacterium]